MVEGDGESGGDQIRRIGVAGGDGQRGCGEVCQDTGDLRLGQGVSTVVLHTSEEEVVQAFRAGLPVGAIGGDGVLSDDASAHKGAIGVSGRYGHWGAIGQLDRHGTGQGAGVHPTTGAVDDHIDLEGRHAGQGVEGIEGLAFEGGHQGCYDHHLIGRNGSDGGHDAVVDDGPVDGEDAASACSIVSGTKHHRSATGVLQDARHGGGEVAVGVHGGVVPHDHTVADG